MASDLQVLWRPSAPSTHITGGNIRDKRPRGAQGEPGGQGPTSMTGLEASTFSSMLESPRQPPTVVKYLMAYLADAVFPAPDSPLMMRD